MENIMTETTEFYSTTLLNSTGDITLTWEDGEDAEIKKMIQDKIDAGYCFFILEPRVSFLKALGSKKKTIRNISEIKGREVVMETEAIKGGAKAILGETLKLGDEASENLFKAGRIGIANVPESDANYNTVRKAKTANEVMKSHTVATPRIVAG
jgi:hypothetical protein